MKLDKFQEQIFFSTVRITVAEQSGTGSSIGTGFLCGATLKDSKNSSAIFLVSNRHVYGDTSRSIALNFHKRKTGESKPALGEIATLRDTQFNSIYEAHPDPSIDLACINVSTIAEPVHNIFFKQIPPEMIHSFSSDDLLPGTDVWFAGYPENRFDVAHNLPILRRGYIASIPTVDFNSKKQFVIDAQVFPGSSGSPVFATVKGKFELLGVVSETMIRNQQLQIVPANTAVGVQQLLGLGLVIKAPLVKELIDHAAEQLKLKLERAKSVEAK